MFDLEFVKVFKFCFDPLFIIYGSSTWLTVVFSAKFDWLLCCLALKMIFGLFELIELFFTPNGLFCMEFYLCLKNLLDSFLCTIFLAVLIFESPLFKNLAV